MNIKYPVGTLIFNYYFGLGMIYEVNQTSIPEDTIYFVCYFNIPDRFTCGHHNIKMMIDNFNKEAE